MPKLEIDTKLVIQHLPSMPPKPEFNVSSALLAELRPERIGYRLNLLRLAYGKKPAEMADFLGIKRTYWSRFEGGKRAITDSFAALIVERTGVTLDFLILGKWDKLPADLAEKMRAVESKNN